VGLGLGVGWHAIVFAYRFRPGVIGSKGKLKWNIVPPVN
jgi:hypothetical protein